MNKLPKIVSHRLKAKPRAEISRIPMGMEHPDANLLSAFTEQTVTAKERALVLEHLAGCAACREQIALGQWLQSFKQFPPRQKPGSFNLDQVMEAVTKGAGDK